jgi:GT2 family glycosyltransferase
MVSLSVIIATCGRPDRLDKVLERLQAGRALHGYPAEVIVADNHPDKTATAVVRRWQAGGFPVRRIETKPFNKAAALNAAIGAARTEWLAFTDDDCEPDPSWLVEGVAYAAESGLDVVAGRVAPGKVTFPLPVWLRRGRSGVVPWGTAFVHYEPMVCSGTIPQGARLPLGSNLFVRAFIFSRFGGYDERLWARCGRHALGCEDGEFAIRLQKLGVPMGFCSESLVIHPVHRERVSLKGFVGYAYSSGFREPIIFPAEVSRRWFLRLPRKAATGLAKAAVRMAAADPAGAVSAILDSAWALGELAAVLQGRHREVFRVGA